MPTTPDERKALGTKMAAVVPEDVAKRIRVVIIMYDPEDGPNGSFTDTRNCSKEVGTLICANMANILNDEALTGANPETPFDPYK